MEKMDILVACEFSQVVTTTFREKGHNAYSCDVLPCEGGHPEWHIQDDILKHLSDGWDMMIAHPPCTYLSRAGARWLYPHGVLNQERFLMGQKAATFFKRLLSANIPHIAIENPIPLKIFDLPKPTQKIEPYYFGEIYSKRTWLWLKHLPPLMFTLYNPNFIPLLPSNTGYGRRKGQKYHFSSINSNKSSITFIGIAKAMAEQWG